MKIRTPRRSPLVWIDGELPVDARTIERAVVVDQLPISQMVVGGGMDHAGSGAFIDVMHVQNSGATGNDE